MRTLLLVSVAAGLGYLAARHFSRPQSETILLLPPPNSQDSWLVQDIRAGTAENPKVVYEREIAAKRRTPEELVEARLAELARSQLGIEAVRIVDASSNELFRKAVT